MTKSKIHPQRVQAQNIVKSKDKTLSFALDGACLLVKVGNDYPMPLDAIATHALLNLLWLNRMEIIEEAKKHNGIGRAGRKEDW